MDSEPGQHSDQDLLDAIRRGDGAAFEVLYRRHREAVHRMALRFAGDGNEALDIVQEVFLYVFRRARRGDGVRLTARMTTFLYPAVRSVAVSIHRRRRRWRLGPVRREEEPIVRPPNVAAHDEHSNLAAALGALSDAHREVLLLRFVDGMSIREISVALGVPEGTVKSRVHHALRALRADERTARFFE